LLLSTYFVDVSLNIREKGVNYFLVKFLMKYVRAGCTRVKKTNFNYFHVKLMYLGILLKWSQKLKKKVALKF
jgi:hypothetical protein